MKSFLWWMCYLLINFQTDAKFYSAAVARERLITELFINYNAASRPVLQGKTVNVTAHIETQHIDFRESDGTINLIGLMDVSWNDPKLTWNPNEYNNLTKIPISQKIIWIPDLEIYNNAPHKFLRMHRNGIAVLAYDGNIVWSDAIEVTMFCTSNPHKWPHDQHMCKMVLGSWTHDGLELNITNSEPVASLNFDNLNQKNMEYRVTNYTAEHVSTLYDCCPEPYISINYYITIERYSSFVSIFRIMLLSIIFLSVLALFMEPWRAEKIYLNGITFLIITFNLIYFANKLGSLARTTPFIVILFSGCFVLVTLTHCVSIFALMATRSRFRGNLPPYVQRILKSKVVQYIAPVDLKKIQRHHGELNTQFEDVKLQEFSHLIVSDATTNEWTHLAIAMERIALLGAGVIFIVFFLLCFI